MKIVIIGSGNVATHLAKALYLNNITISQIFSRTLESAKFLAEKINASYTNSVAAIDKNAEIYIYAIKDDVLLEIIQSIDIPNAIHVHTAGSINIEIFRNEINRYGVLYPLQTFSKNKELDFRSVPLFIEASDNDTEMKLFQLASMLSDFCYKANSEQRKSLHVAAVFACNFTNYMYSVGAEILESSGLYFEALKPLILETADKIKYLSPIEAQTGPATRNDKNVIDDHLKILESKPELQKIYKDISDQIFKNNIEKNLSNH